MSSIAQLVLHRNFAHLSALHLFPAVALDTNRQRGHGPNSVPVRPHQNQASRWPDTRILFGIAISAQSCGDSHLKLSILIHPTQPCQRPRIRLQCLVLHCSSPSKTAILRGTALYTCISTSVPFPMPSVPSHSTTYPGLSLCDATCLACEHGSKRAYFPTCDQAAINVPTVQTLIATQLATTSTRSI
ncbi:hypothetical protein LY78DRAFT_393544 [Colletotrichum sublineola]|nr:hypothetical protein LY78DRAFT_393544 [Colletotrichum sublineola]